MAPVLNLRSRGRC